MTINKRKIIKKSSSRFSIVLDKASRAELIGTDLSLKSSLSRYRYLMTSLTVCLTLLFWNTTVQA